MSGSSCLAQIEIRGIGTVSTCRDEKNRQSDEGEQDLHLGIGIAVTAHDVGFCGFAGFRVSACFAPRAHRGPPPMVDQFSRLVSLGEFLVQGNLFVERHACFHVRPYALFEVLFEGLTTPVSP